MKTISFKIRRIILSIGLLLLLQPANLLFSQQFEYATEQVGMTKLFLGAGLGVNDYGLGLNLEVPLTSNFSINGNAGLGGWGFKLGGSLNYYPFNVNRGNEFSIGYSSASGLQDFTTQLPVEPNGEESNVNLDLNMVGTVNLMYTYNLQVGRSGKIAFTGGYAICLTKEPYVVNSPVTLTSTSMQVLKIMQPGGLIIGIKFMIGIM
jgi:hypothetical protein